MERNALISGLRLEFRRYLESTIPDKAVVSLRGQIKHIRVSDEHPRADLFIGKIPPPPPNRVLPTRAKSQQGYDVIQQND